MLSVPRALKLNQIPPHRFACTAVLAMPNILDESGERDRYFPTLSAIRCRTQITHGDIRSRTSTTEGKMLSPRFLRLYADKCWRSAQSMNDPGSVAEFEAMARDLKDWADDPAVKDDPAIYRRTAPAE
jgi:hypothetical protein